MLVLQGKLWYKNLKMPVTQNVVFAFRVRNPWHRSCKFETNLQLLFTNLDNMDARVSLEVFFVKTNKFVIPTSRKFTRKLFATDPCLRLSKYWGSWSCHSKSKQNISIKYSSIPTLEFLKHVCKNSLKSVLWILINLTYAEKRAWTGFWNVLFV